MKGPVRFAVVGCGHIGKRHVQIIQARQDSQLVAVADIDAAARSSVEAPALYETLTDLMARSGTEVDVVSVCTPNGTHVALALEVVRAGKHVVLEKPMGLEVEGVEALRAEAQAHGVTVFGVMQNRYAPAAQWMKRAMEQGVFGDVRQVHVQCLWNRDERYYAPGSWRGTLALDGGPLFTQFSHFLDILMWVFGEVEVTTARFTNQTHQDSTEFEDGGSFQFNLSDGGWGTFTFSTSVQHGNFESSMTVVGENGTVRIGGQYMDRLDEFALPGVARPDMSNVAPPNDYGGYKGSASSHHHVYDNVIDVLLHGATAATPIEEGLAVVRVIAQAHALGRS
jgi:predicted dehydrogenase